MSPKLVLIFLLCRSDYRAMVPWPPIREGGREGIIILTFNIVMLASIKNSSIINTNTRCCWRRVETGRFWCASLKVTQATMSSPSAAKIR